jgi:Flp pilus assembly protein TadD
METGNPVEAVRYFQEAVQIKPEYGEAHGDLGIVQKSLKNFDAVEINFRKAVSPSHGLITPICNLRLILKG